MATDHSSAATMPAGPWNGPRRRVVVAMSGGVDSSLVAAMMHRLGHEVIGVTLQLYDHGAATGRKGACCAGQDIHDARRVAAGLDIAHYVLDYEARFRRSVIEPFAASYAAGETPIPCVACNQTVKFGDLLETAGDLGADVMATGHYVLRSDGSNGPELYRAADAARDQSYFLYSTTRRQLERLWFPLGGLHKSAVRQLAGELDLPVAGKPDSQDICFVPTGGYAAVVERLRPDAAKPGDIVHVDGRVLGRHDGIMNFTIGQRRGLGIAMLEPLFVVRLDAARRQVIVGPRSALAVTALGLRDVNWLGSQPLRPGDTLPLAVRLRSSQPLHEAELQITADGRAQVVLSRGEFGIAAGQACVFYADVSSRARVLGGGVIAETTGPAGTTAQTATQRDLGRDQPNGRIDQPLARCPATETVAG